MVSSGLCADLGLCDRDRMILPTSDEIHDLHAIAVAHHAGPIRVALEDDEIVFDRNAARVDVQSGEELGKRERAGQVVRLAIERDGHLFDRTPADGSRFERLFDWSMLGWYREQILSR